MPHSDGDGVLDTRAVTENHTFERLLELCVVQVCKVDAAREQEEKGG